MSFQYYLHGILAGLIIAMILLGCSTESRIARINKKLKRNKTYELKDNEPDLVFSGDLVWERLVLKADTTYPFPIGGSVSDEGDYSFIPGRTWRVPELDQGVKYAVEVDVTPIGVPVRSIQLALESIHKIDSLNDSTVYTWVDLQGLDSHTSMLRFDVVGSGRENTLKLTWASLDTYGNYYLSDAIDTHAFRAIQVKTSNQFQEVQRELNLYASQGRSGHFDRSKQVISEDSARALGRNLNWQLGIEEIRLIRLDGNGSGVFVIKDNSPW